ncbi:MAG TPA: GAF domain-containing protein, partial [Ramlibacter sp.]|nr:GAF domain-containing protein [Ramlibacter sp.]
MPHAHAVALARVALAAACPTGPELFARLVAELAAALEVPLVLLAVFAEDSGATLHTLAASLDGDTGRDIDYPAEGIACIDARAAGFQFVPGGLVRHLPAQSVLAREHMDALAALPLTDSAGEPLGLLLALDRRPLAPDDAERIEDLLKIVAARAASEIERTRTDETLRAVALAVSASRSSTVFDELVRLLATILHVEVAFIARHDPAQPGRMRLLAIYCDGRVERDVPYPLEGSPCATVLGQRFRAYPVGVQSLFPADREVRELGVDSYAGHPLASLDGTPLGTMSVASRRPLTRVGRIKATLKIFAV